MTAEELIRRLNLEPHPKEGGWFRETYRSDESATGLASRYPGSRSVGTCIYYLLTPTTVSALHRLRSDEIFHFYLGDPVRMLQLWPNGEVRTVTIGNDFTRGQSPQVLAPRGVWQGSRLEPGGAFALLGCSVAPGFDYADYEHGDRRELTAAYPAAAAEIEKLTS
jgi:uncharacterized protein